MEDFVSVPFCRLKSQGSQNRKISSLMPHSQKREVQVQVCLTPGPKNFVCKLLKMPSPQKSPPGSLEWGETQEDPVCAPQPGGPAVPALPRHLYVIWFLSHLGLRGKKL